jgi:hypothetical protein
MSNKGNAASDNMRPSLQSLVEMDFLIKSIFVVMTAFLQDQIKRLKNSNTQ